MADYIFPQDEGTGVPSGNETWLDAANQTTHAHDALGPHVVEGLNVTAPGGGSIDVSAGLVRLYKSLVSTVGHDGDTGTRAHGNIFSVIAESRSGLSLPDESGMNYVYVSCDPANVDSVTLSVNGTETEPSNPSLKIAEVDGSNASVTSYGRPSLDAEALLTRSLGGGLTNGQTVTDLLGTGLTVTSGALTVSSGGVQVNDGGSINFDRAATLNLGASLSVSGSGDVADIDLNYPINHGSDGTDSFNASQGLELGTGLRLGNVLSDDEGVAEIETEREIFVQSNQPTGSQGDVWFEI